MGIEGTGIRPGFIKIGVDAGPLTDVNRKLVQAAARTHLERGLSIAVHTGDGAAAMEELSILRNEGVDPEAWIWVHAQNEKNTDLHRRAAEQGGWVGVDGIGPQTIDRHVELVHTMKRHGLLGRTLISQDAGWYSVGEQKRSGIGEGAVCLKRTAAARHTASLGSRQNPRERSVGGSEVNAELV